jgi:hypothetical protein
MFKPSGLADLPAILPCKKLRCASRLVAGYFTLASAALTV